MGCGVRRPLTSFGISEFPQMNTFHITSQPRMEVRDFVNGKIPSTFQKQVLLQHVPIIQRCTRERTYSVREEEVVGPKRY